MKSMNGKCVIFDMDGVIVDSEPLHQTAEKKVFRYAGVEVQDSLHHSFVGTSDLAMWTKIVALFQLPYTAKELMDLKQQFYTELLENTKQIEPIAGVIELIHHLNQRDFKLALASSSPHSQISFFLNRFNLSDFFDAKVSGEDVLNGKPNPDIFLKAAQLLGVQPENCLVIEDSSNGISAAKKATMKCIGFQNHNSGKQDLSNADAIIDRFDLKTREIIDQLMSK
jgi:beta-phosphoglucomutase family hydrolase